MTWLCFSEEITCEHPFYFELVKMSWSLCTDECGLPEYFLLISLSSSHRRCSVRKDVLGNFAKFTGKQLRQSLFFNKVFLLKKRLWHSCFPVNFAKFLRAPFLQNTSGRLLYMLFLPARLWPLRTALVMNWSSILLEHLSVCILNICSAIQKISKTSALIFRTSPLFLVFSS